MEITAIGARRQMLYWLRSCRRWRVVLSFCDICNTPVEGTKISAGPMQRALAGGFNPFGGQYIDPRKLELWRLLVQQNTTDWNLCDECLTKVRPYVGGSSAAARPVASIPGSTVLTGHADRLMDVAISSDGNRVLTCGWDATVRLWDFATGAQLACLRDHKEFVGAVAFAPDGRTAASGGGDQVIRIWDLEKGIVMHRLHGHSFTVHALQFSADGSRLLSGSGDSTVQLWDVRTGKRIKRFGGFFGPKHESGVESVAFSPDESRAISVGLNGILWDVNSGKAILGFAQTPLWAAAFGSDGQHAIVSGPRGFSTIDLRTGLETEILHGTSNCPRAFALTRDGRPFVGESHAVTLYDVRSRRVLIKFDGHSRSVTATAITPDGRRGASASDDRTARTWQLP